MKIFIVDNENKVDRYAHYFREYLDEDDVTLCEKPTTAITQVKAHAYDVCIVNVAFFGQNALDDLIFATPPYALILLTNYTSNLAICKKYLNEPQTIISLEGEQDYCLLISTINAFNRGNYELGLSKKARGKRLFVKQGLEYLNIPLLEVKYLHSEGNYTSVIHKDHKVLVKKSLTKLMQLPKFEHFIRTQRNFAINTFMIKSFDFNHKVLHLTDDTEIPIGRTYIKALRQFLAGQMLK